MAGDGRSPIRRVGEGAMERQRQSMTRDELTAKNAIYARVSRRGFMGATAAATLSALVGREPRLAGVAGGSADDAPPPMPSSCCGWPAAWRRPRRSIRSATRRSRRACRSSRSSARFRRSTPRSTTSSSRKGLEQIAQRDRSRHGHPHVQRRRPRLHPALAAPVSLAHRLHPAAADGDAAPRRGDLEDARAEESGHAGVHRHRPDGRRAPGRSARSRRFTPRASSAPSTARS